MIARDVLGRFLQYASLAYVDWLDVRAALRLDAGGSPLEELALFGDRPASVERALALLRLDRPWRIEERTSPRPVHDGFIASLELVPAPAGPADDGAARVRAFVDREQRRDAESLLRERYGRDPALDHHEAFRLMDYPVFDTGTATIGFAIAIERDRRTLWSRIAFAHK